MKKNLTTTKSTDLILKKSKSMLNITNKILSGSKNLTTKSNKDVILNPDVMMINGLMWQKETAEEKMSWYDAMEYAENLRLGGYDDWRLPSKDELREMISYCGGITVTWEGNWGEILNKNIANNHYQYSYKEKGFRFSDYWSSTTDASNTNDAWYVNFNFGDTSYSYKDSSFYVRCVRAGQ